MRRRPVSRLGDGLRCAHANAGWCLQRIARCQESGIWAGDTGPAADKDGNIFVATGNGTFDGANNGRDYGDSVLKLGWNSGKLDVLDYFTPYNQDSLNRNDKDLGSGGVVLLPSRPGSQVHALVVTGKGAVIH